MNDGPDTKNQPEQAEGRDGMDMGKYVAVGVLAVIVLAAATYEAPDKQDKTAQAQAETLEGSYGGATHTKRTKQPRVVKPKRAPAKKTAKENKDPLPNAPPTPAATVVKYTVKAGQSLRDIAFELCQDRGKWRELYEQNKHVIPDPDTIRAGMTLVWRKVHEATKPANKDRDTRPRTKRGEPRALPASAPRGAGVYVVAQGDTLYRIASRKLGKGSRYKEIMAINDLASARVRVGQRLRLPNK